MEFAGLIEELDHGRVNASLSELVRALVAKVDEKGAGAVGSLTLKLTFTHSRDMAQVSAEAKVTPPKEPMHATLFHFADEGCLSRDNPKQIALPLQHLHEQPTVTE